MKKRTIYLSESDRKNIEAAVKATEQKTNGEIVPLIVRQSHRYRWVNLLGIITGWVTASVCLVVLSHQYWEFHLNEVLLFQMAGAVLFLAATFIPPIKRMMIAQSLRAHYVEKSAYAAFIKLRIHQTRDHTGILIYVSLLERRVHILADKGIHQKVPAGFWNDEIHKITHGIHEGNFAQSLIEAINDMGQKLIESFPRKPDDTNELSDTVRAQDE